MQNARVALLDALHPPVSGGIRVGRITTEGALASQSGDPSGGELALDPTGNPVVATSTETTGLPVTPGAPQPYDTKSPWPQIAWFKDFR